MTSNEIRNIIEGLSKPEETNVFYTLKEITKPMDNYVVDNFLKNKSKYMDEKLIAIFVPKKTFTLDCPVYFLDRGVIIREKHISYDEIIVVGKLDFYHEKKYNCDCVITYGDEEAFVFSKGQKTERFACDVIDIIIDKKNALHDSDKKIRYYLNLYNRNEGKLSEIIIYQKVIQMTQDPDLIGKLVEKFGAIEFMYKYTESKRKGKRKIWENILSDCLPYLELMQKCNQFQGYNSFVRINYMILINASKIQKTVSNELIYEFNAKIDELSDKLDKGLIEISQKDKLQFLSMIKYISDIYSGKIIIQSESTKRENKYNFLKNADRAYYWLDLYINQEESENTAEYEDVMFSMADIYKYGTSDIEPNDVQMLECLKTAARNGGARASKVMAEYCINHNSEDKDKWIQLAKDNGQKIKDKRSINEKMKESIGIDINEAAEMMEAAAGLGIQVAGVAHTFRNIIETVGGIKTDRRKAKADRKEVDRNDKRGDLDYEQWIDGQKVRNKTTKAMNMRAERKADKAIAKEEKKRR